MTMTEPTRTDVPMTGAEILANARALAPVLRRRAAEIERNRSLPEDVVQLLRDAGVFRIGFSTDWGGPGMTSMEQTEVIEALAYGDASVGWCAKLGSDIGLHVNFLDQDEVHTYGFTGLRVRYDAGVAFPYRVVENLDAIRLQLTWKPPAVRGQQVPVNGTGNCITRYPSGCDLLETATSGTAFYTQGTLYAPLASVSIKLASAGSVIFRSGIVVRSLQAQVPTSAESPGPVIQVPNDSAGALPLDVYFRAYAGSTVVGTARVRYPATDPTATPVPGRRAVTVLSWTIRRA